MDEHTPMLAPSSPPASPPSSPTRSELSSPPPAPSTWEARPLLAMLQQPVQTLSEMGEFSLMGASSVYDCLVETNIARAGVSLFDHVSKFVALLVPPGDALAPPMPPVETQTWRQLWGGETATRGAAIPCQ